MFLFGCCLSLSISSDILRSLPVVCCFEVLCSFHTQTAFLSCSELWPGPDGEGPDMPLIKAECVSVSVCEAAHKPPSTSPSNYTKWCLRSSLSTHWFLNYPRSALNIQNILYLCFLWSTSVIMIHKPGSLSATLHRVALIWELLGSDIFNQAAIFPKCKSEPGLFFRAF